MGVEWAADVATTFLVVPAVVCHKHMSQGGVAADD